MQNSFINPGPVVSKIIKIHGQNCAVLPLPCTDIEAMCIRYTVVPKLL